MWEKCARAIRSALASLRPRVSLFAGAVFVLLTLFLPIAYNACSPNETGAQFIAEGSGHFPLVVGLNSDVFGRSFYTFVVLFAALTFLLVMVSRFRPQVFRGRRSVIVLYGIAGTLSLYLLADAVCFVLGWGLLRSVLEGIETRHAAGFGLILVLIALCLRSKFLRRSKLILALLTAGALACVIYIGGYVASLFLPFQGFSENARTVLYFIPMNLYWAVPACLWYRFGLRPRQTDEIPWPRIRSYIVKAYLPALGCVPLLFWLVANEHVWGFIPFSIGMHLMSVGYMQLARKPLADPQGGIIPPSVTSS
jgi:hypothetical protein